MGQVINSSGAQAGLSGASGTPGVVHSAPLGPGQSRFGNSGLRVYWRPGTHQFIVPPGVYKLFVRVGGAGGSGAAAGDDTLGGCAGATGGAGGGFAAKIIDVTPGQVFTVTVGAGGASVTATGGTIAINGNAGGSSSFGAILSATGGGGGLASYITAGGPLNIGSATPGSGFGGDMNAVGGHGGSCKIYTKAGYRRGVALGGGSAATILGDGASTGSVTLNDTYAGVLWVATGGAGVLGGVPDATPGNLAFAYASGWNTSHIHGGGSGGPPTASAAGPDYRGGAVTSVPSNFVERFTGDIIYSAGAVTPGVGGGSTANPQTASTPSKGGYFAGGAAYASTGGNAGGQGGQCAGGGAALSENSVNATSGPGGDGLVIVEW